MTLGKRLREARLRRAWSLSDLSAVSGISRYAIRQAELDQTNPSVFTVKCLADALGASLDYLLGTYEGVANIEQIQAAIHTYRTVEYRLIPWACQATIDKLVEAAELLCGLAAGDKETKDDKV